MRAKAVSRYIPAAVCFIQESTRAAALCMATILLVALFGTLLSAPALAQDAAIAGLPLPQTRITQAIDESQLTRLKGNTHPLARPQNDLGTAPATLPMERMLLVLKRGDDQEHALRTMLDDQQDKFSPNYHKWLTPEQFGKAFGPSDADMQTVVGWLQSHGFQVSAPSKGRTVIEFSGSASQVQEAFHTTIHKYLVNGEQHWANASDPSIPTALMPAVAGVYSLHNFLKKAHYRLAKENGIIKPGSPPQVTFQDGSHGLVPGDYAVIYNINPVYTSGINGTGITIGVVARSQIQISDILAFQSLLKLTSNVPNIIVNGSDPGDVQGDDVEGTLDATWSQAIAPGATVDFVVTAATDTTDGVILSELYIVENNLANIMTASFGGCEARFGGEASFDASLAEQAAAQGISFMNSTGDAGAEGCDNPNLETVATQAISADLPATTPFVTAVGGTEFNENGQDATYWNAANTANGVSAKSYIPEDVWNQSCAASTCGNNANIAAGGGGPSAIFAKPSWQSGVTGIPTDGARDVPDVALTAAGHDPYIICFHGACQNGIVNLISGTSASAPSFAGIMALIDQKMSLLPAPDNSPRQGLANYVLYPLAASENSNLSKCNGSSATLPLGTCIFNDVTVGNNAVPDTQFTSTLYPAGTGYDLATGLGSVNVTNLVNAWAGASFRPTTTSLKLNGGTTTVTVAHGASVNVAIGVAPNSGTGTPAGDVSLIAATGPSVSNQTGVDGFTLTNAGTVSGTTSQLPGGGPYAVHAHYAGNSTSTATGTFAPSDSNTVMVKVTAEDSSTTLAADTFSLNGSQLSLVPLGASTGYGNMVYFHAETVAKTSPDSSPTGTVSFADPSGPAIPGNPYALAADPGAGPGISSAVTAQGLFTLPAGSYSVTAQYNSDPSFNASASSPLAFTITQASTSTAASSSANSVSPGASVTLTANISTGTATVPSFGAAPTGTVKFFANGNVVGTAQPVVGTAGSASFFAASLTPSFATASLTTTALPTGADTINAQYSGDANYSPSTSSQITVNVQPDFSLPNGGLGTVTIASPGGMGTVNLALTPGTGFNSAVTFTCTSGLPAETTCGQGSIAAGATTGTMTVQTTGSHTVALRTGQRQNYVAWLAMGSGLAFGGVFLVGGSRRRRWTVFMSLVILALLVTVPACGGGGSSTHTDPGTPVGMSTVTVTAAVSGGPSHTTTFVLNVQ
jgi:hypothetical protein